MKTITSLIILLCCVAALNAQGPTPANKFPIKNGLLQSDLTAAGYKILNANLSDYAGVGMSWNASTNKLDVVGGTGGGGSAAGSSGDLQWNNAGALAGGAGLVHDAITPLTALKALAANTFGNGLIIRNPTAASSGSQQFAPGISFQGSGFRSDSGTPVQPTEWRLNFNSYDSNDGSGWATNVVQLQSYVNGAAGKGLQYTVGGTGNIFEIGGDSGMTLAVIQALDYFNAGGDAGHPVTATMRTVDTAGRVGLGLANQGFLMIEANTPAWDENSADLAIGREAAGAAIITQPVFFTDGSHGRIADGATYGSLHIRSVKHEPATVATLPVSPTTGQVASVNDGVASLAWGATVTGGGSAKYLVWYNGTNWTVLGK
jgi:hypothetical protein